MTTTIVLIVGALIIAWIIFSILINIVKTTVKTAIIVAAIVLLFQFIGIGPGQLGQFVSPILRGAWEMVFGR
jgi:nitrate/nitrite transporter NarK